VSETIERHGVSGTIEDAREEAPRIRDGLRETLWAFLGARVLLFVISLVGGGAVFPLPPGQPPTDSGFPAPNLFAGWHMLITATERQDALWYLRLATTGYRADDQSAAFYPLFPMAVRAVAWLPGIGPLGAALIVANLACFGALLMLHALTRMELGRAAARRTVLFAALFPTAFFLLAPYGESLFLLLSVCAFWFARRNRWGLAALAGAGAALTRSAGVLLIVALAVEAIRQWRAGRPLLPRLAGAAAIGIGPLLYFGYWQVRFSDFWAPLSAQRSWQREAFFPLTAFGRAIVMAGRYQTWWLMDLVVVVIAIVAIWIAAREVPLTYTVYAGLSVLLPMTFTFANRPLISVPRYFVVVFPIAWGLAISAERRRPPETAILVGCAAGYALLAFLFVNWLPAF
jgi:hypothetical protein